MSAPLDQRPDQPIRTTTRSVTRWEIAAEEDHETFRDRFEQAVPALDYDALYQLVAEKASWDRVVEVAGGDAPHGFMIYWKLDTFPVMSLAGHRARATEYLMGNHVIAEQMARHDAGAFLYAPLRTTIHEDPEGRVRLSIDRPSDLVAALERPEITEVGHHLDRKVAELLEHLDMRVPAELDGK